MTYPSTGHFLTPTYLAEEVARLVALRENLAAGWHRADWRHRTECLRMYLDTYSDAYIQPALLTPRSVQSSPAPLVATMNVMTAHAARNGVTVDIVGDYDIQNDDYRIAAFFARTGGA
jgi:hypothetical protein